jgi:ribonuclease HI
MTVQDEVEKMLFEMYFDGCSKGNPGPSGAGAVLYQDGKEMDCVAFYVGDAETNNVAEYQGLIGGLQLAKEKGVSELYVRGDSQLVIRQMRGEYQVKSPSLQKYHGIAMELARSFAKIEFVHVFRYKNQRADALSNEGLLHKSGLK